MDLWGSVPTPLSDKKQKPESGGCSAPDTTAQASRAEKQPVDTTAQASRTEKQPVDHPNPPPPSLPPLPWPLLGLYSHSLAQSCFCGQSARKRVSAGPAALGGRGRVGWRVGWVVSAPIR